MLVKEIMNSNIRTASPDSSISEAALTMCFNKISGIPVAKDGKLVGIISMGDVHKAIFQKNINSNLQQDMMTKSQHQRPAVIG